MAKKPRGYYSQNEHRRSIQYLHWRKACLYRDVFTCDICLEFSPKGKGLEVHHLDSYAENEELRLSVENGITLCKSCHKKLHKIMGRITTKKMYEEFKHERS